MLWDLLIQNKEIQPLTIFDTTWDPATLYPSATLSADHLTLIENLGAGF